METISFYSYKGGTGRSLVVANVARYLARFGQRVVVLDFDLEAPGLHYKFGLNNPNQSVPQSRGLVDYLYEFVSTGKFGSSSLKTYMIDIFVPPNTEPSIHLMPAGSAPSADYWHKLSKINWHELFYAPDAKGVNLFLELKERIQEELKPDFLLIDSRTGITEMGGAATTILPDKLVCLLLANRENLDGTRSVLRSLYRNPSLLSTKVPEIIPVISRIPIDKDDVERKIVESTRNFLNEEADNLEETLDIEELFVLHSEPDLQLVETILVGENKSPEDSLLLRDYLHLFLKMIPADLIQPHIGTLVDRARSLAFDKPDFAQKELEALIPLGHPQVHRELLKFYRLRNAPRETILLTARRLWDLTKRNEQILWDMVKTYFVKVYPESKGFNPSTSLKGDLFLLSFVEFIWQANGSSDVEIGCALAESFDNFDQGDHAAKLLSLLVEKVGPDKRAVVQYLRQVYKLGHLSEAKSIIDHFREQLSRDIEFVAFWARIAIDQRDREYVLQLLDPPMLERLSREKPTLTFRLLYVADRLEQAKGVARRALTLSLQRGDIEEAAEIGRFYHEIGDSKEFESIVHEILPERDADRVLEATKSEYFRRGRSRLNRFNP